MAARKNAGVLGGLDLSEGQKVVAGHESGITIELVDHRGHALTYTDESGNERRVWARFAGQYGERYAQREREIRDARWEAGEFHRTPEQREEDDEALIASMLLDWGGFSDAGAPLEPTAENCLQYMRLPWVKVQFVAAVRGRVGFFGESSGD